MADDKNGGAAVYVSWTTFKNALEALAQGVPNVVDRTAFAGQSWGVQSQLLAGFKFLGLIADDGKPTPALHGLAVHDEEARKKKLDVIIRDRYSDLFALDLSKTTPAQLGEQMTKSYRVTGDTREKAMRFFLAAVDYLGIPVSRFLKRDSSGNGTPATPRRRRSVTRTRAPQEEEPDSTETPTTPGMSRIVNLRSGGTLTLSASLNIFDLSDEDQQFVFELIGRLKKYEQVQQEGGGA